MLFFRAPMERHMDNYKNASGPQGAQGKQSNGPQGSRGCFMISSIVSKKTALLRRRGRLAAVSGISPQKVDKNSIPSGPTRATYFVVVSTPNNPIPKLRSSHSISQKNTGGKGDGCVPRSNVLVFLCYKRAFG